MRKEILWIIVACVLLFVCFGVGYNRGKKSIDIQTDTVEIERTVVDYKPIPTNEYVLKTQRVKVPTFAIFPEPVDTHALDSLNKIIEHLRLSTDSLEVELQRVQRHYQSEDYEAWVSGVEPALDSIKIKQQIKYITTTQVVKKEKFFLNVGLDGSGWLDKSYTIYPNINASFNWKWVTFTGEVGLDVPLQNTAGTVPYVQIGVNYSLWSF